MELGTPRPVSCLHQLLAMSIWANCLNFPNLKILICRMGIIIVCIHPELWKLNYTFRNYNLNYTFKSLEQLALKTPYYYYYYFFYGEQLLLLFLYGEKSNIHPSSYLFFGFQPNTTDTQFLPFSWPVHCLLPQVLKFPFLFWLFISSVPSSGIF